MELYSYTAKTAEGKIFSGEIEADSEEQAARLLRERRLIITKLSKVQRGWGLASILRRFRGIPGEERVTFTRQLSTMVSAGLPLTQSLEILIQQTKNQKMREILQVILRDVEGGTALSTALGKHREVFSRMYVNLIQAGEASGALDQVLARLAETLEGQRDFKSKIKGALIYPAIVIAGMVVVFVIIMVFVVPRLTVMYQELGAELPLPTKLMIGISNLFINFWWLFGALLVGLVVVFSRLREEEEFRRQLDRLSFKIPIFGALSQQSELAEFTRTLALLLGSGLPILDALEIVKGAVTNSLYKEAIMTAREQVSHGVPLATPLRENPQFPAIVSQMISVGEETGKLDEVLTNLSRFFQAEAEHTVKNLATALEPAIMIFLGLMVGLLIVSVILPIYKITAQF